MSKYPFAFYYTNRVEIDLRAAKVAPPPFASPLEGAFGVAFGAALIASLTLGLAGSELSEFGREKVATAVALICGALSYLFFRSQEKAFGREVERECEAMWVAQQPEVSPTTQAPQ